MSLPFLPGNTVNGQKYQAATTELRLLADTGADFLLTTWKDVNYKTGAKKMPVNRADGKIDGWTIGKQETSGSMTLRLDEYFAVETWLATQYPTLGILQVELTMKVVYGNSLAQLRADEVRILFDEVTKKAGDDQAVLMAEVPLFVFDVKSNGRDPVIYSP